MAARVKTWTAHKVKGRLREREADVATLRLAFLMRLDGHERVADFLCRLVDSHYGNAVNVGGSLPGRRARS